MRRRTFYFKIRNTILGPLCLSIRSAHSRWQRATDAPLVAKQWVTGMDAPPSDRGDGCLVPTLSWDDVVNHADIVKLRRLYKKAPAVIEVVLRDHVFIQDPPMSPSAKARALTLLAKVYGCEPNIEAIKRRVYKGTDCGAWVAVDDGGVHVGSIVEGSDAEVYAAPFRVSSKTTLEEFRQQWDAAVSFVEDEADALWREANESSPADK